MAPERDIPDATVARLPVYRRTLVGLAAAGETTVSSARLAELAGVNAAKVRKDLSRLGTYGVRGVGYEVENLLMQIGEVLGVNVDAPVVIVGMGNLGQALARYGGFSTRGFRVVALTDSDPKKIGKKFAGLTIQHQDDLPKIAKDLDISVGIITTPAEAAQQVADELVAVGVGSILNFAPTVLNVPAHIPIRKVDLATELQILGYYQHRAS
ncbi:MAG: redox-sensing transcriptional repressor Rex [Acidimicrobiales bacterium]|nr:redox-sensing transcriptional repressor Rex [Acidimicrobiales bacterium]RZV46657.1 MAG: redox-sensing transcriptional repressor Rex [Acidimicrobiales bacterium]